MFNHDSCNAVPDVNVFTVKNVLLVIRLNMFCPSVNTALDDPLVLVLTTSVLERVGLCITCGSYGTRYVHSLPLLQ